MSVFFCVSYKLSHFLFYFIKRDDLTQRRKPFLYLHLFSWSLRIRTIFFFYCVLNIFNGQYKGTRFHKVTFVVIVKMIEVFLMAYVSEEDTYKRSLSLFFCVKRWKKLDTWILINCLKTCNFTSTCHTSLYAFIRLTYIWTDS